MPVPRRHLGAAASEVVPLLEELRHELGVPDGSEPAAADEAQAARPRFERVDRTDLELVTIDPEGSRDLDQAVAVDADGAGFVVWYAIADVGAWVEPGGAVHGQAWRRGMTLYAPDQRSPLHPVALSEGRASLLPDQDTPAVLWRVVVDGDGRLGAVDVERATVRSRAALSHGRAQQLADAGDEALDRLARLGRIRIERQRERGGVSLDLADQDIERTGGHFVLRFRSTAPIERWNEQVSLLTGAAAARIMGDGGRGIVRTLPEPDAATVDELRRRATTLDLTWPEDETYAAFVGRLRSSEPREAALLAGATRLFRGAGYEVVREAGAVPEHAAIASPYAHVTAPLRRLVDRYATELVLAIVGDRPTPEWIERDLEELPGVMAAAASRAGALDRAVVDLVEALVLRHRVGEHFEAVAVAHRDEATTVQLREPAVVATVDGHLPLGDELDLVLQAADPETRSIRFEPA